MFSFTEEKKHRRQRWDWLLLLLALLSSFGCIFCSTRLALSIWEDRLAPASLLAGNRADYRLGPRDQMKFGFLDPLTVAGAATDSARLHLTPRKQSTPVTIALLPRTPTLTGKAESPPSLPEEPHSTPPQAGPGTTTATAGPSPTLAASATGTPQATQTPVPGTPTTTPQPTATSPVDTPTAAFTATPADTSTPQATPTDLPTPNPTSPPPEPTDTPLPPPPATATATSTATATPTPTPTDTPTATPEPVSSILESVVDNGDGTCTAWWGYDNPNAFVVNISIGSSNRFNPAPDSRGQPDTFNPGRVMNVFSTVFSDGSLSWLLDGGSATAGPTGSCRPYRILGTVFEDVDYLGGPGTPFGGGDVGLGDIQVELYQGAALITTTTTGGSGQYLFSGLTDGTYTVRVVSASIGDGSPLPAGVVVEQTYEHNGLTGEGGSGAMGGNIPGDDDTDTPAGAGMGDTNVPVTISGASLTGVDFGFADNVVVNTLDDGQGSLRQTLTNTNIIAGLDTVVFNIGTGQQTIVPASALPAITDPVIIDGTTQDGFSGSPIIELDGSSFGGTFEAGLSITAGNSTVRGLVINSFDWRGIELIGGGSNIIEGNYIGPYVNGLAAPGGGNNDGIHIEDSANNRIGGTTPSARNLISGNDYYAIHVHDTASTGNVIQGNYIGVDISGSGPLGNVLGGVVIEDASNTTVTDNVIAYNGNDGVTVMGTTAQNIIRGNSIYANNDLGIDLADDGVTLNDGSGDLDPGPNNLQNYPILDSVSLGSDLTVTGRLTSTANTEFVIELFAGTAGDPSGNGEGQFYLDFFNRTTNDSGVVTFTHSYAGSVPGNYITVTATDSNENTSEFSPYVLP